jgi:hypothetical protein
MTEEEISRFALQLSEAERIRALMAQDADSKDGVPLGRGPVGHGAGGGAAACLYGSLRRLRAGPPVRAARERVLQGRSIYPTVKKGTLSETPSAGSTHLPA